MDKYGKEKSLRKLKWTNIPNDDAEVNHARLMKNTEKREVEGKADREQERKQSQVN